MTLTKLNYLDDDYGEHDQWRDDEHMCPDDLDDDYGEHDKWRDDEHKCPDDLDKA